MCGNRPTSLECPDLGVVTLPHGPDAVDHTVVQPEDRITRAGVLISHHTTYPKVTSSVRALEGFQLKVKGRDICGTRDEVDNIGRFAIIVPLSREVAMQAAGVVTHTVVGAHRQQSNGTEIDSEIGKWTRFDAASTCAWVE